jgi:hypothetical protein
MRAADFTLDALLVLAMLTFVGAWLWTRADRRKRAQDGHRSP